MHNREPFDAAMNEATVIRAGAFSVQVCVPEHWSDQQVIAFAERENPCGTMNGWFVRTDPKALSGSPSRNPCANSGGMVHITLDA